ncbi:DUF1367 family protein [Pseudomonas nicosulfuronedens]|uniref:hypothetical protein n=1 Tax=Pseudomonas nicosulfuronedens TaxID=2571105 RepID=UPI002446E68F|nr:hypothetical protein [Pseudomonas nicosulfuronedens]MDH1009983.1 DUF1367 family protein [Pseudomonas nicosulfuronedens]MDH1978959.1 DUF1367 family protein [Pseudomonas nicosulfuronedens]MDH2028362.1 DUF1367 family protein [Pseudomonas nicosulfuronedens]
MAEALAVRPQDKPKKAKRAGRPVYLEFKRMVDPETGEERLALVADSGIDRFLLKERGYKRGDKVRAELKLPRNLKFHRLVHALGRMCVEQIEDFHGLLAHDAVKRLQRETGLCCDVQTIDLPGIGKLDVAVAQSLSFDSMDEASFRELYQGICRHIATRYWPTLTEAQVADMAELMPEVA